MDHITQIYHEIESHWLVITALYIPAFFGWLNCFAASFKVMGWTKLSEFCGKLEDAAKAFVDARKQSNFIQSTTTQGAITKEDGK